jgi:quinoprotein glucose dehydrogenase
VFHTIPRRGEPGYETWLNGSAELSGNAGVWGPMSADPELGYVYLNVESATNDVYGGHRPGNNLYSDSLVCLDIRTGRKIWHYQLVRHDIWDYDLPPHPILVNINVDGRPVRAVVQLSKQAFAYVFDRTNGQPVWPIEDRPVPQTDVKGEWTAPTQPFPTRPPAFDVQGITPNDLIDFTPALRAAALQALEGFKIGPIFTPPPMVSPAGTPNPVRPLIQVPGLGGGANWQSGASDSETGFVYVGSATNPGTVGLNTQPVDEALADYSMGGAGPQLPNGLRLLKPPYGRITGYDMNRGVIAFQIPNGDTPPNIKTQLAAAGVTDAKPTGAPSQAHLLVTKNFLFATEGSGGQPIFHAYDKRTGENIWQSAMPAGPGTGIPMSYMHQGKQYVVHAANGRAPGQTTGGAQLVAWTIMPPPAAPAGGRGGAAAPAPGAAPASPAGGARGARGQ